MRYFFYYYTTTTNEGQCYLDLYARKLIAFAKSLPFQMSQLIQSFSAKIYVESFE